MIKQTSNVDIQSTIQVLVDAVRSDLRSFLSPSTSKTVALSEQLAEIQEKIPESLVDLRRQAMAVVREPYEAIFEPYFDDENDSAFFIYEQDGELKGAIGFVANSWVKQRHVGFIRWFWVREDCRGTGIGTQLFQTLSDYVTRLAYVKKLSVELPATNHTFVLGLFERRGFEVAAVRKRFAKYPDGDVDFTTMEKWL